MKAEKIQEEISKAREELLERIRDSYRTRKGRETAGKYIQGLLSGAERKNGWQLSEQLGENTPYRLQQFLYRGAWDADSVRDQLRNYVCEHLGEPNGVLVVDETGFLKQGRRSVGVKRQYSGTAGRVENCQIGVFLTYASHKEYVLNVLFSAYFARNFHANFKEKVDIGRVLEYQRFSSVSELKEDNQEPPRRSETK